MHKLAIGSTICVLSAILVSGCTAANTSPKIAQSDASSIGAIASYDKNGDQTVTCEEWQQTAATMFTQFNTSGSGALTEAEYNALEASNRNFLVGKFNSFDANSNGTVERQEFVDSPNPAFSFADKDGDCNLTSQEIAAVLGPSAPVVAQSEPAAQPSGRVLSANPVFDSRIDQRPGSY